MVSNPASLSDLDILKGLRQNDPVIIQAIYTLFRGRIIAHITRLNGTEQEAKDIFQDGLTALFINAHKPDFQLTSSFYTYLHSICHNLWLKKFREKNRAIRVRFDEPRVLNLETEDSVEALLEYSERQSFFVEKFSSMGENCRRLLHMAFVEEISPEDIVALLGLGSLAYYYKRKSNCKEKLVELMRSDGRFKEHI